MDSLSHQNASGLFDYRSLIIILLSVFQHLMVTARRYTVIIEEKLLMKLLIFFGYGQTEGGV